MKIQDALTHSRNIKLAKGILLTIFLVLTSIIFVLPFINTKNHSNLKLIATEQDNVAPIQSDNSTNITKPKFYGFDNANRPYTITADTGTQIDKDHVELNKVFSDIKLDEGKNYISLNSNSASVLLNEKTLKLKGEIEININSEYKISTDEAFVDYGTQSVSGNEVKVEGTIGEINANSFKVDESYKVITFQNKVHTTLNSN